MNSSSQKQSCIKLILCANWMTRTYLLTLVVFYLLDRYYNDWANINLSSNVIITVIQYQVWRGLLNFLYEPNLYVIMIMIFHLVLFLSKFQRQNGTIIAIYQIITIGLLVQFLVLSYEAIIYILNDMLITQNKIVVHTIGAGGVLINIFFKFLYFNYKQLNRKLSCRALVTYFYPLLLLIALSYLCEQLRIDMIAGYFLALIQCFIFKGGIIFYTPDTYTKKQKIVFLCRLNKFLCCGWSNLNEQKIKPNRLCVVEARQFYILKNYQPAAFNNQAHEFTEIEIETERGTFYERGGRKMEMEDNKNESKGQKWEKEQIIEDQ